MITEKYNKTYHIGIKWSPKEALEKARFETVIQNSDSSTYRKRFGKIKKYEEYTEGDKIRICMRDNVKGKDLKGRSMEKGIVMNRCGKNAVIIKKENGKINLRDVKKVVI